MHYQVEQTVEVNQNSPIRLISNIYKNTQSKVVDENGLYDRLNLILLTLNSQKDQFEEKVNRQKKVLQERINQQSQVILELESKVEQLQQQTRQLRFNYHQRGGVVEYLKKKVLLIQKKFDSQKQEMLSVVKYLESRNSQLNQLIYQLKNKQTELNNNIFELQEKFLSLTNQYCNKTMTSRPNTHHSKPSHRRASFSNTYQNNPLFTLISLHPKPKNQHTQSHSRDNFSNLFLEDLNDDSIVESTIREKTIKNQNPLIRVRSEDQIDFAQLNHIISLGTGNSKAKATEIQLPVGKSILINNYGHLNLGDYPSEQKPAGIINQKKHYLSKPKLSLPNQCKYTQLSTRRTNKDSFTSREL